PRPAVPRPAAVEGNAPLTRHKAPAGTARLTWRGTHAVIPRCVHARRSHGSSSSGGRHPDNALPVDELRDEGMANLVVVRVDVEAAFFLEHRDRLGFERREFAVVDLVRAGCDIESVARVEAGLDDKLQSRNP